MLRYLETLFRHRFLLTAPMVMLVVLALGWVLIQPPTYASTVRLWVEKQQLVANPNDNPYLTPAQEQTAVLSELVNTKYFCVKVGHRSPLAATLSGSSAAEPSVPQRLLAAVGLGNSPAGGLGGARLDDAMFTILSRRTLVFSAGPQIMTITFSANDAVLAAGVAQAIADQFIDESLTGQRLQASAATDFYTGQVKQAQAELAAADAAVDQYLAGHPDQRAANAVPDARMVQLKRNDDEARGRYAQLQSKLDQSKLDQAALARSDTSGIRILDKAEVPSRNSIKRMLLMAGGVSAVLGIVVMVVGILVLTLIDSTFRRPEELQQVMDLRPVGTVPRIN